MRMSTILVNGIQAENCIQNLPNNISGSYLEASKMKNISNSEGDYNKILDRNLDDNLHLKEMSSLKELIVIHLDYIQQQSEQLSKKNNHITELKNENEMLKQRLARMERRVSLQKHRGDRKQYPGDGSVDIIGRKRRLMTDLPSQVPVPISLGKKSFVYSLSEGSLPAKRIKQERPSSVRIKQESDESESAINLDDILTTRIAYHTLVGERPNCLLKYVKRSKKQKTAHLQLEVPRWRIKQLNSTYSMEGTEDLSDDAFSRRHYKLMGDEKKRKRWDVQRIRDQRTRDLLKLREKGGKRVERQHRSFWPQYAEGLRLSVTSLVPVSAFGINLPASNIQDFSLPWKEGARHSNCKRRAKR